MIKSFRRRIAVDPRGKITSGRKSDKGYPQSLEYFNVDGFPELAESYGPKPTELTLFFPSDEITDFFDCEFNAYGAKETKVRSCDGETCIHRINEELNGAKYVAGEATPCVCSQLAADDKKRCKYVAYLRAWIVSKKSGKIENHLCYLFQTHSQNSGDNIYSELEKVKYLSHGGLRGITFSLSVKMVSGRTSAQQKFPIWELRAVGTVAKIQQQTKGFLLAQSVDS